MTTTIASLAGSNGEAYYYHDFIALIRAVVQLDIANYDWYRDQYGIPPQILVGKMRGWLDEY